MAMAVVAVSAVVTVVEMVALALSVDHGLSVRAAW
jgi:hypothetical protein